MPSSIPTELARFCLAVSLVGSVSVARGETLAASTGVREQPPEAASSVTGDGGDRVENAVVKVFSTLRNPDPLRPWTKQAPREVAGSGVIIENRRILTAAHVVLYASQVEVQANHAGDRVSAAVEVIAPGLDLAVLRLDDERLFGAHAPLACARTLPSAKDAVAVYGFPVGGSTLAITKGIVSRIEFAVYAWPVSGLVGQIDAAINPGNSGGPAVVGGEMVGLVSRRLMGAQNIGYIVPCEEIGLFRQDVADGKYDGKPALLDELQTLENDALRSFLKLDKSVEGIVVRQPYLPDPGYPLKRWDVISKIGDTRIDDQGMVGIEGGVRVRFAYLVQKIARNGLVPLTVWREGRELKIQVPVSSAYRRAIPDLQGSYPSYFVYGPLVFSTATVQFVAGASAMAKKDSSAAFNIAGSPLLSRRPDRAAFAGEEIVVVSSPLLPHKLGKGYSNPIARVVRTLNGVPIKNLLHLVELLRDCRDEFVAFEFVGHGEDPVFRHKEMIAATEEILTDGGIRTQGSPDAMAVWSGKAAAGGRP